MDPMVEKLEKPALKSKKFVAFLIAEIVLAAAFGASLHFGAVAYVQAIVAASLGLNSLGYVLGTAFLESAIGKAAGLIKPQLVAGAPAPAPR